MVVNFKKDRTDIFIGLLLVTYVGLYLPINISNILTTLLLVFCALNLSIKEIGTSVKNNSLSLLLISIFIFQVAGLIYTSNFKAGLFMLEKKILFVVIPLLLLPMLQKSIKDYESIFRRIGMVSLIGSLLLVLLAFFRKYILGYDEAFSFESYRQFEGFTPIHYVYYSIYFSCGSLMLINSMIDRLKNSKDLIIISGTFIYSLGIVTLVASKTGIAAFLAASLVLFFLKTKSKKAMVVATIIALLSISVFLYFNDTTRSRFEGLSKNLSVLTSKTPPKDTDINDLNMRLLFWKISIQHALTDHQVIFGTGTGDAQDYIDSLYLLPQYLLYGYVGWDSHNQWVFTFIQLGLIGIILLTMLYFKALKEALRAVDINYICFVIITFAFSLTESILEQNKGVAFFVFFLILFTSNNTYLLKEKFS